MTADILIWASPVYVNNVSSIMKILIERLALSCHTLDFAGTLSFTLTTTKRTGGERVSEYLRNIQISMGFKNLDNFIFTKDYNKLEDFICSTSNRLVMKYNANFGFSNKVLESRFLKLRSFYKESNIKEQADNDINEFEKQYWNQHWIRECKSFQEYATKNRILRKMRER